MSKGYSIRVRIGGRVMSIISDAKPEYMSEIAAMVDNSITGLLQSNSGLTYERAAVLTALKFCDEATTALANKPEEPETSVEFKQRTTEDNNSEADNLRKQVLEYANELSRLERENKALLKEMEEIKKKIKISC